MQSRVISVTWISRWRKWEDKSISFFNRFWFWFCLPVDIHTSQLTPWRPSSLRLRDGRRMIQFEPTIKKHTNTSTRPYRSAVAIAVAYQFLMVLLLSHFHRPFNYMNYGYFAALDISVIISSEAVHYDREFAYLRCLIACLTFPYEWTNFCYRVWYTYLRIIRYHIIQVWIANISHMIVVRTQPYDSFERDPQFGVPWILGSWTCMFLKHISNQFLYIL